MRAFMIRIINLIRTKYSDSPRGPNYKEVGLMKDKRFTLVVRLWCALAICCVYPRFVRAENSNAQERARIMEETLKAIGAQAAGIQAKPIAVTPAKKPIVVTPSKSAVAAKEKQISKKKKPTEKFTVSVVNGYAAVSGDDKSFRQDMWMNKGYTGGIESFTYDDTLADKKQVHMEGRALSDSDYKLLFDIKRQEFGYMHMSFDQFRKYYDDSGGQFVFSNKSYPNFYALGKDLYTDRLNFALEFGLTLPDWPKYMLGYEHQEKRGEMNLGLGSVVIGSQTRYIYPLVKEIEWAVDAFKGAAEFNLKGFNFVFNQRLEQFKENYRSYDGTDALTTSSATTLRLAMNNQPTTKSSTTSLTAEGKINKKLYVKAGDMFSTLSGKTKWDRTSYVKTTGARSGTYYLDGEQNVDQNNNAFSTGLRYQALSDLLVVARFRQQNTTTSAYSNAWRSTPYTLTYDSDVDELTFGESLGLEYSGIARTRAYLDFEAVQAQVKYAQDALPIGGGTTFWRDTHVDSNKNTYTAGMNTRPIKPLFLSGRYRRIVKDRDTINYSDPAVIGDSASLTDEFTLRTNIKPNKYVSFTIKYQDKQTKYDVSSVISPEEIASFTMEIISASTTITPFSRLSIDLFISKQESTLKTNGYNYSGINFVDFYNGNYNTYMSTVSYSLNPKTSLTTQYQGWTADGYDAIFQAISMGLERRLKEYLNLKLKYSYYVHDEGRNAGINDYKANVVFVNLDGKF